MEYTREDWQQAVWVGDTLMGYYDWVAHMEMLDELEKRRKD